MAKENKRLTFLKYISLGFAISGIGIAIAFILYALTK
jgi:hypothetical protein